MTTPPFNFSNALVLEPLAALQADDADKLRTLGKSDGRRCLVTFVTLLLLSGAAAMSASVPIQNDTVWNDDRGQEIMCQGGNLAKFGDTFYFYGWADYPGDNRKDTITCYSSRDLASWKFERHIYTRDMTNLTLIVPDRLHVIYNATTKKYVMIGKHILPVDDPPIPGQPRVTGGVSFFTSDTPASTFTYLGHEMLPAGASPGTDYHRDLAAFQNTDGTAYVVSSHDQHKPNRNIMITRLTPDYLKVDRAICEIPLTGVAREAPYIIKLKGRYWLFVSGHGVGGSAWNGSPTSYTTAEKIEGPWTPFRKVKCEPESADCFNAQTDFLFEVRGSAGSFILWGGDRWSQRTKLGIGKNVWLPLQWNNDEPILKWYATWNVAVAAGTWTTNAKEPEAPPTAQTNTRAWTLGERAGRQCLIMPDGKPFLMLGISHVGGAFAGVPQTEHAALKDKIERELRGWGFNTVPSSEFWDRFPFIVPLDRLVGAGEFRFEDVFDPAFKARLRKKIVTACEQTKGNPNCIGYWWTDIPPWPLSSKKKFGKNWVEFIRDLPDTAPGKKRYAEFLAAPGSHDDLAFLRLIARELYTDSAKIFRELDPQRLIFGERYDTFNVPKEILEEAAKVVDVISVQPYEGKFSVAKYDEWHQLTGKPIVISDWNLSFPTPEHSVTMWPQFKTPAAAAEAYETYLRAAFAKPYILGYFKCQYVDQVLPTGMLKQGLRKEDGMTYEEFAGLLKALHQRLIEQLEKEGRLAR